MNQDEILASTYCRRAALSAVGLASVLTLFALARRRLSMQDASVQSLDCKFSIWNIASADAEHDKADKGKSPLNLYEKSVIDNISWRLAILPYLGYLKLYSQYNKSIPWDSQDNLLIQERIPEEFSCRFLREKYLGGAVLGKNNIESSVLKLLDANAEYENGTVRISANHSIQRDSIHPLVCCVGHGIHWMSPEDITIDRFTRAQRHFNDGTVLMTCSDGKVVFAKTVFD